ncbi:MAG: UDP-N-acetylmuramate dehydrogenase, partial [Actinobacteria bacterium]|nr:UDP-N-acetylmuramate dehydrogenase [Actinomycetota bacterium]
LKLPVNRLASGPQLPDVVARAFTAAASVSGELTSLAAVAGAGMVWVALGAGSNLLVADQGYRGVLIKLGEEFQYVQGVPDIRDVHASGNELEVTVGAGAYLSRLSAVVAEAGLSGLEFGCGIPGSIGGAVAMNAGAHGASMADVVETVELVTAVGAMWVPRSALDWGYRYCALPPKAMVTAIRLRLCHGDAAAILARHRSLLRARRQTQPRAARTFGSVFKNPPSHSAGRLLEAAGLKGVRRGGAEVSNVHANFIVNHGDATTADVLALMGLMRQGVHRMTGILLEPEVRLLGGSFPWDPPSPRGSMEAPEPHG